MSKEERCNKCRFFDKDNNGPKGDCRRYPPQVTIMDSFGNSRQSYPRMMQNEWCGEFRYKDKFIEMIAKYEPDTNVVEPNFTK